MSGRRILSAGALALGILAGAAGALAQPALTSWTDRSGAIAAGGTSQQVIAANGARRAFFVQNPCAAVESLFIEIGSAAAVSGSIELPPCAVYQGYGGFSTTLAVHAVAATTGHAFIAKEAQ